MARGTFIVIDGIGGCGKTTVAELLAKRIGARAMLTHEPGGAPRAEKIREILLRGYEGSSPLSDFFLFWAARAEHVIDKILPALKKGQVVISDRFDSATYAFQIVGEQHPELGRLFWRTRETVLQRAEPDFYIILDVPIDLAAKRRAMRQKTKDRFDEQNTAFQKRVRSGFQGFAKKVGKQVRVIDGSGTPEEVEAAIWKIVSKKVA